MGLATGLIAGSSLISGIFQYYATKETNKLNRQLFDIQRGDQLAARRFDEKMAKESLALNKRQQAWAESEAEKNRREALEQKGYGRMQLAYQRGADLLTQQMNMNAAKAAPLIRGK
jgi:hypothetical protein